MDWSEFFTWVAQFVIFVILMVIVVAIASATYDNTIGKRRK